MAQVHQAKVRVTCDLEIPQFQKNKGIEIEFRANDQLLGELHIMGAHVYFWGPRKRSPKEWSFTAFVKMLEEDRK